MPTKKKSRKMDAKLVAAKQKFEISFISKRYKIPTKEVKEAQKAVGRSRTKVYNYLRSKGYNIPTRKK